MCVRVWQAYNDGGEQPDAGKDELEHVVLPHTIVDRPYQSEPETMTSEKHAKT